MLNVNNLTCGYANKPVLTNINFKLDRGDFVGVIGPNGSGKTTLLRAMTKIIKPYSGTVSFNGKLISRMNFREAARNIAVVCQEVNPYFDISVEEFVGLGRIPHQEKFAFIETKEDERIIRQAMEMAGIVKFRKRSLKNLSGGERQMVVIAKALAQQPKLLLLDEPTVYLDISHQVYILDLIRRLNKEQKVSVLIVLHELNLASEYCQRLILLDNGSVEKIGTPQEVLAYEIIERVYKTTVVVRENPISHKPYVFIVPEEEKKNISKA
ncbi:MAG: ABC transporter ATP-binding protein [Candidatus Omnitrophica bacterium]|nr:ABC transporter ATP-binding protein [Candidatus Omnitrophota bacterium]